MGQWFGHRVKDLFHRRGFLHRHEQCGRGHWAEDQSGALRAISRRIRSFVFHAEFCFGVTGDSPCVCGEATSIGVGVGEYHPIECSSTI